MGTFGLVRWVLLYLSDGNLQICYPMETFELVRWDFINLFKLFLHLVGSRSFEESLGWLSSLLFLRRAKASMQPCNFSGWLLIWSGRIVMMGKRDSLRVSIFTPGLNPGWLHNMTLHCAVKTDLVSSPPNKTLHSKMSENRKGKSDLLRLCSCRSRSCFVVFFSPYFH